MFTLRRKQMLGFLIIAAITAIVGLSGYLGMKKMEAKFRVVIESTPLIDSSINMKLMVSNDLISVMQLMAAESMEDLDALFKAHEENLKQFTIYQNAILQGAKLKTGTIYQAKDENLRKIVQDAANFNEKKLQPNFAIIYEQMEKQVKTGLFDFVIMDTIDDETIEIAKQLDKQLDAVIELSHSIILNAEIDAQKSKSLVTMITWGATTLGIIAAIVLGFLISGFISKPVIRAADFIQTIADGDFTQNLEIKQKDEIGSMVDHMNTMVEKLGGVFQNITDGVTTLNTTSSELSDVSDELHKSARHMSGKSGSVADSADAMSQTISSIATTVEESSANLDTVSVAMEQLNSVVNEIAKNTGDARSITKSAVEKAQGASVKVDELGKDANEVGQVTEVISEISGQTNLLALNATIEAARAGEAGKGFAVVANEIKDLAQQTAEAAANIKSKIDKIQSSTQGTVTQIGHISNVINEVDDIVSSISGAVEEQSITTQEISSNIAQAAEGIHDASRNIVEASASSNEIAKDISTVNTDADGVNKSSEKVNSNVANLKDFAMQLKEVVGSFKV
ncbi:MAG: HAMP domain-containing protein [Desulfobacteraceae bacterium]|nr:HAMP domain-containing protein [Desulfobacteraceae bacterium]